MGTKNGDCLYVCTKSTGCNVKDKDTTHKICKPNNVDNYNKLNKYFE